MAAKSATDAASGGANRWGKTLSQPPPLPAARSPLDLGKHNHSRRCCRLLPQQRRNQVLFPLRFILSLIFSFEVEW